MCIFSFIWFNYITMYSAKIIRKWPKTFLLFTITHFLYSSFYYTLVIIIIIIIIIIMHKDLSHGFQYLEWCNSRFP
jgi:hypothetical protein